MTQTFQCLIVSKRKPVNNKESFFFFLKAFFFFTQYPFPRAQFVNGKLPLKKKKQKKQKKQKNIYRYTEVQVYRYTSWI